MKTYWISGFFCLFFLWTTIMIPTGRVLLLSGDEIPFYFLMSLALTIYMGRRFWRFRKAYQAARQRKEHPSV